MRTFENYMVFIMCVVGTIMLVTCDEDDHQKFYNDMLKLYTKYRAKHGAKPLILDNEKSQDAMHYLKLWIGGKVIQPHIDTNYHIYESKSTEEVTAKTIFFSWYDEGEFFNYNQESNDYNKTEHFTQILWKESEKVGFAFVYENNTNYFAATYFPRGNISGEYVKNVRKPKKDRYINNFTLFMD